MLDAQLDFDTLRTFAIALFIGALVGVDREQHDGHAGQRWGGIRTFMLIALAGALSAWMSTAIHNYALFFLVFASLVALLVASYISQGRQLEKVPGLTTEMAAMVVFQLGGAAALGETEIAVALAIVTSGLLTFKADIHEMVGQLGEDDVPAMLKLLFATFIILPVLPDQTLDPWGALNPYKLWWLVILISALSLVGYVAVRLMGPGRGLAITGLAGGLVSSTAVTLAFARRSLEETADAGALAVGILLAWSIMFGRVLLVVGVVNQGLVPLLAQPLLGLGLLTALIVGVLSRTAARDAGDEPQLEVRNPFSLVEAMKFGALFAGVMLMVSLVQQNADVQYLYVVAALAGGTDADAVAMSLASDGHLAAQVAVRAILVAALANTLVKCGIVCAIGSRALAVRIASATAALVVVAAAVLAIQVAL